LPRLQIPKEERKERIFNHVFLKRGEDFRNKNSDQGGGRGGTKKKKRYRPSFHFKTEEGKKKLFNY